MQSSLSGLLHPSDVKIADVSGDGKSAQSRNLSKTYSHIDDIAKSPTDR